MRDTASAACHARWLRCPGRIFWDGSEGRVDFWLTRVCRVVSPEGT